MTMGNPGFFLYIFAYLTFDTSKSKEIKGICNNSSGELQCCTGYIRRQDKCVGLWLVLTSLNRAILFASAVCPAGTYGAYCSSVCPEGFYGVSCVGQCGCEKVHCDPVTGCDVNFRKEEVTIGENQVTTRGRENDWTTNQRVAKPLTTEYILVPDRSSQGDQSLNIYIMAGSTGAVGILCVVIVITVVLKFCCKRRTTTKVRSIYNTDYSKSKRNPSIGSNEAEVPPNGRPIDVSFSGVQNEYAYVDHRGELKFDTFAKKDSTYLDPISDGNISINVENCPVAEEISTEQGSGHVNVENIPVPIENFTEANENLPV